MSDTIITIAVVGAFFALSFGAGILAGKFVAFIDDRIDAD